MSEKSKTVKEIYLNLRLIEQNGPSSRSVLLILRLPKKRRHMHIVSHRKAHQITKIRRAKKLDITYSPLGSGRWGWGRCLPLTAMGLAGRRGI